MSRHSLDAPLAAGENVDASETDAHLLMRRQSKQAFLHGCITAAPAACAGWLDVVAADRRSVNASNLIGVVDSCVAASQSKGLDAEAPARLAVEVGYNSMSH